MRLISRALVFLIVLVAWVPPVLGTVITFEDGVTNTPILSHYAALGGRGE